MHADGVRTSELGHTYTSASWSAPGACVQGQGELRYKNVLDHCPAVRESFEKQIKLLNCGDAESCEQHLRNINN